jgi:hypothetical protein
MFKKSRENVRMPIIKTLGINEAPRSDIFSTILSLTNSTVVLKYSETLSKRVSKSLV